MITLFFNLKKLFEKNNNSRLCKH